MNIVLTALINLIFMSPSITANLDKDQSYQFTISGESRDAEKCLDSGLEIRYRLEAMFCTEQGRVFGSCSRAAVKTNFLSKDIINSGYKLVSDLHRDEQQPSTKFFKKKNVALKSLQSFSKIDSAIIRGDVKEDPENSLWVRVYSECEGEYNETFQEIAYYLSFGLIRIIGFNTGWQKFQ